jgi:uncharacterized protein YdhG (YjbR/CyaY superfamily)
MKYIIIISVFATILSGCKRNLTPTKSVEDEQRYNYEEDLSLVRPEYEPRPVEKADPIPAKTYVSQAEPPHINEQVNGVIEQIASRNKAKTTERGYRIQVFSGNNRTEYEKARGYILQYFPNLETYVSYSQPTYKLKVGDFLSRTEAENHLSSLQSRFVAAKIIYDNVNYKKALTVK